MQRSSEEKEKRRAAFREGLRRERAALNRSRTEQRRQAKRQAGDGESSESDEDSSSSSREGPPRSEQETYEVFEPVPREEVQRHRLSELIGLDEQIGILRSSIVHPVKYAEVFKEFPSAGLKPNVLLYGPAGTGKTDIALGLANETGLPIYKVSSSQVQSSFQGRSRRNFAVLIETAAKHPEGAIVFFDEADTLLGSSRTPSGGESDTSIVNIFKELIQVGRARSPERVIVIAATNFPGLINDVGILSRFAVKLFVGLPVDIPRPGVRVRAYRTEILISIVDSINKRRCGDNTDHKIGVPQDYKVLNDMETILFFYTPRELEVIAQMCWRNVEVSPFHLEKFRYHELSGKCTNVYKPTELPGIWKLVRATEATETPAASTTSLVERTRGKAPPASSSVKPTPNEQALEKREADLKTIDQLSPEHMRYIRWDYITFDTVVKTLKSPGVFPSVTLESLLSFYTYAKETLRDYEGTSHVLRLLERGYKTSFRIKSDRFNKPEFTDTLPDWNLPEDVVDDLDTRRLWTHPKKFIGE